MNFYLETPIIHPIFATSLKLTIMIPIKEHVHSYLNARLYSGDTDNFRNELPYGQQDINKEMKLVT